MNQELEQLIEKLEGLREAAKRAHLEDKAIAFDIAVNNAKAMIRSRPVEDFGTVPEELSAILDELRRATGRAESVTQASTLKDVAAMIQGRLAEISPRMAAERRIQDMKHPTKVELEDLGGPRKTIEVQTDDGRLKVGRLSHEEAQLHRGVPSWVVKMIRFLVFIPLAFVAWVILIGWLAGEGGTTVTGRICASVAGLIWLLVITAYIHEFNQRHP